MTRSNRKFGIAAAVVAIGLLCPALAAAGPLEMAEPLLASDCSFEQVDAALHDHAPQLAMILDSNPELKADLRVKFEQPVEERRADLQNYLDQNPDTARRADDDPSTQGLAATLRTVADTCHGYVRADGPA
ncbi:hemophore-related protein [Nocardia paucivorans]|uniref:hemophore-related protein n=1 Tax=Nocardia paucivorans TaxID=114259 RepID=UPI0002D7584E|nr:hemophore-related protein [Nocardia paucivorans]